MNAQEGNNNVQIRDSKNDFLGKFLFKLHYIKLYIISGFCTSINSITWRLKGVNFSGSSKFFGFSKVCRYPNSIISIKNNCTFRSDKYSNLIGVNRNCIISTHSPNAIIKIGSGCGFSGITIGCLNSITIGNNVLVGANVIITDFDWHSVDPSERKTGYPDSRPIIINDNVFIGVNSVIWKGVTIGENSVIGANSLVTKDVPPNTIYGGNPAKLIKTMNTQSINSAS